MFGNLFEDDGLPAGPNTSPVRVGNGAQNVPEHRGPTNLCGIENLGATCYLNSFIQTILFTPEFKEGLMQLDLDALSMNEQIRVIPLQLQKLLAQLLLLDVSTVSTCQLTDSFGWTNNDELYQQQDVQELIRILFPAIQKSLVGTPGHDLIPRLFEGYTVSQVQCRSCQFVSVRDESYLDLTLAVGANKTLKSSLFKAYEEPEMMTGSNQYLCPTCKTLTDATKVVKLRHLPPILTLSLLRFLYDPVKQQRFKDESRLEFPLELDMAPFCEVSQPSEVTVYELLSVIVHRGGAHGGHYHAIIHDIDKLGNWDQSDQSNNSFFDPTLPSPELLISDILANHPDNTMTLKQLLDCVYDRVGVPWSKSYNAKCGSIAQFLNNHCTQFYVEGGSDLQASVTLISDPKPMVIENGDSEDTKECNLMRRQWFDFNDAEVVPVKEEDIENYFEGEESAYMLVYRRKSLQRPAEAIGNPAYAIPDQIQTWVHNLNNQNEATRENSHLMWVRILPRSSYSIIQKTLIANEMSDEKGLEIELTIDARESLATLKKRAREECVEQMQRHGEYGAVDWNSLNFVHQNNYSLTIQDTVPDYESVSMEEYNIEMGQAFLAWNEEQDADVNESGLDFEWENVECTPLQPAQHCAVVLDNSDAFNIRIKHTVQGMEKTIQVCPKHTISHLRGMLEWQLLAGNEWCNEKLGFRLGEDIHNLEPPLHDHLTLSDACIKPDSIVYVEPTNNGILRPTEVWLTFSVDDPKFSKDVDSLVVDTSATIRSLVDIIFKEAGITDDDAWHIGKTNITGEVIHVFNNPGATVLQEKITHGSHLVIRRGWALAPGLTRIKIMIMDPQQEQVKCPSKLPKMTFLGHVDVLLEATTVSDLKNKILTLLEKRTMEKHHENYLRVRFLLKSMLRPGKILRNSNQCLKNLNVGRYTTLLIEILNKEENLRSCQQVLQVWQHITGGYTYSGPQELVWDQEATSLAAAVSQLLNIEQQHLVLARYQPKEHQWDLISPSDEEKMVIEEQDKENCPQTISESCLTDGDIIGVKDSSVEKDDLTNFTTSSDLERWIRMQDHEDNQQRSTEAAAAAALEWTAAQAQSRIPERGIRIHVSDFC